MMIIMKSIKSNRLQFWRLLPQAMTAVLQFYLLLFPTTIALLAASCTEQAEKLGGADSDRIPVTVSVAITGTSVAITGSTAVAASGSTSVATSGNTAAGITRAGTGLYGNSFAQDDQFYAVMTGTTVDATTFKADGSAWTPMVQPYLRQTGTATIRGYFPWRNANATAGNAGPALTAWTVSQDQTSDANYQSSDLMYAPEVNISTSGTAALTFHHRMAKVIVKVTNTISATIQAVNLVQGYRTVNLKTPATLTPYAAGDTGAELSDAVGQSSPLRVMKDGTSADATVSAACLLPPQAICKGQRFIEVKTDLGTAYYAFDGDGGQPLAQGTEYTATCNLSRAALGATTAITGWTWATTEATQAASENLVYQVGNAVFRMNFVKGGAYTTFLGKSVKGTLSDFYMGQTEVTQGLWKAVMGGLLHADGTALGAQSQTGDNYPVSFIRYADAVAFLAALNDALSDQLPQGTNFRLPTEAQWEYAARGGKYSQNIAYTTQATLNQYEWSASNSDGHSHPVAQLKPNELGLYDMLGNIQELTADYCTTGKALALSTTSGNCDVPNVSDGQDLGLDYIGQTATTTNGRYERGGSYGNNMTDNYGYAVRLDRHHWYPENDAQGDPHVHVGLRLALVRGRVFGYTGAVQTYSVPSAGTYRIEAWGAQSGLNYDGGQGGYGSVVVSFSGGETLYVYVGGQGGFGAPLQGSAGGWNGGGSAGPSIRWGGINYGQSSGGGGATHVATTAVGEITQTNSLQTDGTTPKDGLLLVAGGGGGGSFSGAGGIGGGTTGGIGVNGISPWNNGTSSHGAIGGSGRQYSQSAQACGGGGGGFVGGNARTAITGEKQSQPGCGGSSWGCNATFSTTAGIRRGNGMVIVSRIGD